MRQFFIPRYKYDLLFLSIFCLISAYYIGVYSGKNFCGSEKSVQEKAIDKIQNKKVFQEIEEKSKIPKKETTEVEPLFDQECANKQTGWESLKSEIFKNNTIYSVVENYERDLDLATWDRFTVYIQNLLSDVLETSKSNFITIIEVGSWKGQSAVDHAVECRRMAKKYGKECIMISIDTWLGSIEHYEDPKFQLKYAAEYAHDLFLTFLNNMKLQKVSDIVYPLRLPSNIAAHILHCFKIEADIIFVDADHDYKPVLRDLQLYYPLVRKEGVLYGHDIKWSGVNKAVNEFIEPKKDLIKYWERDDIVWFMRKNEEEAVFFE